jgi:methyl-accepting chemotaxis protein
MKVMPRSLVARMSATIAIFAAVLIAFALFSTYTRTRVQVGGRYYNQIVQGKDLVADVLPPPAYIVEAYLLSYQIANTPRAEDRTRLIKRLGQTEKEFRERQEVWRRALDDSRMKTALVEDSAKPAAAFFQIVNERFLPAVRQGDLEAARQLAANEMEACYSQHRQFIDEVVKLANQFSAEREAEATAVVSRSATLHNAMGMAGLLIGVLTSVAVVRHLHRTLRDVSNSIDQGSSQVAGASSQVSAASTSLAEGSSEQAASLEETSASLEEVDAMTKRNATSAEQAKELAAETRAAADASVADMQDMMRAMAAIKTSSTAVAKIVTAIDEIAFQTNILALNAAVEAARAGEAGLGFAVVADEVRTLARRAAQSARETATSIEDAVSKSEHGVRISEKVSLSLNGILEKARQVDVLVAEIATASNEQRQGITQVNTAVTQMNQVTQSNAASAEETAAAAGELNTQSIALKQAVAELQELIAGTSADTRRPVEAIEVAVKKPKTTTVQSLSLSARNRHVSGSRLTFARNGSPALTSQN